MKKLLLLLYCSTTLLGSPLSEAEKSLAEAQKTEDLAKQVELFNTILRLLPADGEQSAKADLLRGTAFEALQKPGFAAYYYARGGAPGSALRIQQERGVASFPLTTNAALGPLSKLIWGAALTLFALLLLKRGAFPRRSATLLASLLLLLFGALFWIKFVRPTPAIVVEAIPLRASPEEGAPLVLDRPLFAAEGVWVLEAAEQEGWLKVRTQEGRVGFGSTANLRLL